MKNPGMDRWFYLQPNGRLRLKRVSAAAEAQFPRRFRRILADHGLVGLTMAVRAEEANLKDTWNRIKAMIGRPPTRSLP